MRLLIFPKKTKPDPVRHYSTVSTQCLHFLIQNAPHGPAFVNSEPTVAKTAPRNARTTWKVSDAIKKSRLNPLSPAAEQMVLGTLLGDAVMSWTNKYGGYRINHGGDQQAYCESKAALLTDYINTRPKIVPNPGLGDKLCRFATVTTPAFEFLRDSCYQQDPRYPGNLRRLVRWVNPLWLERLTWEGIAYWFQDDGHLAKSGNCRVASFSTHRFRREVVEMLAKMLTDRGVEAKACRTRKGQKFYWVIFLTAQATRKFVKKIEPFVHPTMRYKIDVPPLTTKCAFCGELIDRPIANLNPEAPCCVKLECKRKRNRLRNRKYQQNKGKALLNARARENRKVRHEADPELQEKINQRQRERFADPAYRAKQNEWKRQWRLKRKRMGLPKM